MAVRFDADSEDYTRSLSTSLTAVSVACWAKISVDRNSYSAIWSIDNGSTGDVLCLQTNSTGTSLVIQYGGEQSLRTLTVGVWYFLGLLADNSNVTLISRAVGETTFTVNSASATNAATVAATTLRIGESPWGGEWWNGCVTGLRWWNARLSQEEMENECWQHMPHRTNDLQGWYPLLTPTDTADYSGLGRTLSGGSGATVEDGPPIAWRSRRPTIVIPPVTSLTGSLAATLPPLGASVDGTATIAGQVALSLPALGAHLDAAATVTGQTTPVLPPLGADLAGASTAPGLLAVELPPLAATFDGELTGGFITPVLPPLAATLDGGLRVHGTASSSLLGLTAAVTGVVEIPHGDVTFTAGPPRRGWDARPPATGWDADQPDNQWAAALPTRDWAADTPTRRWNARQPTT